MKDIKFRVWKPIEKVMHSHDWLYAAGVVYNALFDVSRTDVVVMQYTGLKDKTGKEIYEGDVIRFLNGETTSSESGMDCEEFNSDGVVFWEGESAQWDITHRIDVSREDVFTDISEYEIVGNIYQNPE